MTVMLSDKELREGEDYTFDGITISLKKQIGNSMDQEKSKKSTKHITAAEAVFLQNQTTRWLDFVNELITNAAKMGCDNVVVNIRTDVGIGSKYYEHPELYRKHLHDRGFKTEWNQATLKITWE